MRKGSDPNSFHLTWSSALGNKNYERLKLGLEKLKENEIAPPEASWFYVHSITFQNIMERDHTYITDHIKGSMVSRYTNSSKFTDDPINTNPPGLSGMTGTQVNYVTDIGGEQIERELLQEFISAQSDRWERIFPIDQANNYRLGDRSTNAWRGLSYMIDFQPNMDPYSDDNKIMEIASGNFKPPYAPTVSVSPINYSFIMGRDLDNLSIGTSGIPTTVNDKFGRRYDRSGIGIPYLEDRGINLLKYQFPSYNTMSSGREEEEFQSKSGDYSKKLIQNNQINTIMEIAYGFVNPIYGVGTLLRMFELIGDTYLSYIDEKAREADALNNYFGLEGNSLSRTGSPTDDRYNYLMNVSETLELEIPTKRIFYNKNKEMSTNKEKQDLEIPINKLYKSFEEFQIDFEEHFKTLQSNNDGYPDLFSSVNITPYMESDYLQKIINKEIEVSRGIRTIYS